ncbi:MAG: damage-inducible protein DinB [Gammaproteobacteria bacterium]|nr:damage-inducible protein DinB [Gammaproteobacteria bacterium]
MISTEYIRLMAAYTSWQNQNIYHAADTLSDIERKEDRGAFFGSIHATLNHLLWGDQVWMHRLAGTPKPTQPDISGSVNTHEDWDALKADRISTDRALIEWVSRVKEDDIRGNFTWYSGISQTEVCRPRWALVVQLFNHGTHHRGQVHAMLTAAGAKPDDTDVQCLRSEHFTWPEP